MIDIPNRIITSKVLKAVLVVGLVVYEEKPARLANNRPTDLRRRGQRRPLFRIAIPRFNDHTVDQIAQLLMRHHQVDGIDPFATVVIERYSQIVVADVTTNIALQITHEETL